AKATLALRAPNSRRSACRAAWPTASRIAAPDSNEAGPEEARHDACPPHRPARTDRIARLRRAPADPPAFVRAGTRTRPIAPPAAVGRRRAATRRQRRRDRGAGPRRALPADAHVGRLSRGSRRRPGDAARRGRHRQLFPAAARRGRRGPVVLRARAGDGGRHRVRAYPEEHARRPGAAAALAGTDVLIPPPAAAPLGRAMPPIYLRPARDQGRRTSDFP